MQTIKIINKSNNDLPEYATLNSAGFDLCANEQKHLYGGETQVVGTGLFMEIPKGYELQIRSRSGLAAKGIVVSNSPGTIDADYRGEVKIILRNNDTDEDEHFIVNEGDRIAQGVLTEIEQAQWQEVTELSQTERGEAGFGSTGVRAKKSE